MSNHFHLVCATRPGLPAIDEVRRKWLAFYGQDVHEPLWDAPGVYERVACRMRDISQLMKDLQQQFTCWFNRTRPATRRGTLWAGRFKSVILDEGDAFWECLKYAEMNPVRSGICAKPEDYRFSSWGRFAGSGAHPFAANFTAHLRRFLGERAACWDDGKVVAEFGSSMARQAVGEAGASQEEVYAVGEEARRTPRFRTTITRRVRYWTDGVVIGSKTFLLEVEARFRGGDRPPKRFDRSGLDSIFSYRQLRI